jgi:S1-C subfamily serine protease
MMRFFRKVNCVSQFQARFKYRGFHNRGLTQTENVKRSSFLFFFMISSLGTSALMFSQRSECDKFEDSKIPLTRNFVADVVEVISPAVVNILCPAGFGSVASGSGFFISGDGYIVTNAHVVAPSVDGTVLVTMKNGRKSSAVVHSMDTRSDLAIVKISGNIDVTIPTIPFGVSSKVRAGEFVIAIGSPMHLQDSVSLGIVSATARHASELGISNNRSEYIQTDAAINMGNSGGPLVNLDGEVIGINTMKIQGSDGISFAIPIDVASQIISQLLANKRVIRPYVGLKMANITSAAQDQSSSNRFFRRKQNQQTAQQMGEIPKVVVLDVVKDSPAFTAGIQRCI